MCNRRDCMFNPRGTVQTYRDSTPTSGILILFILHFVKYGDDWKIWPGMYPSKHKWRLPSVMGHDVPFSSLRSWLWNYEHTQCDLDSFLEFWCPPSISHFRAVDGDVASRTSSLRQWWELGRPAGACWGWTLRILLLVPMVGHNPAVLLLGPLLPHHSHLPATSWEGKPCCASLLPMFLCFTGVCD